MYYLQISRYVYIIPYYNVFNTSYKNLKFVLARATYTLFLRSIFFKKKKAYYVKKITLEFLIKKIN